MGELRAYVLPVGALRALLVDDRQARGRVAELARPVLAPPRPPEPLGPVFTRVPGTAVVRDDEPAPDDLVRLLGRVEVRQDRARATWRLVEAVAAGTATATTRTTTDRPGGLAPLGLAVPATAGLVVGSWTVAEAAAQPSLSGWLAEALAAVPPGTAAPDVVVFWSSAPTG